MTTVLGYQTTEVLYESANSLVYRGLRQADGKPVVLKMLREDRPSPERIAWFKREYERTLNLNAAMNLEHPLIGVVAAYQLEVFDYRWMMVLEDFGGESLDRLQLAGKLDLNDFLKLAVEISNILDQVHQCHIIHKDINLSNIVFNPRTGQIKLIDFGISTDLAREHTTFHTPNVLEGTLAYISPEQTGRMNRVLDYRTDFYSLGITFYELLTGRLPFPTQDTLELVHCHIAQQPMPPDRIRPDIPLVISQIVLKLMAKSAEDRYQSAHGLKVDLAECLYQWQAKGYIEPFALGQHDIIDWFQIPQKLYGRKRAIETLLAAFERVSEGATETMLVSGYAGVGKTALVQEIYKPITRRHGYFISGKFDQFQRNIPYAPLTQAFHSLVQQLLTEAESDIAIWREKLLTGLGSNGQVLIEMIPEIELIVGPQPEVPSLPPTEAQNRFNLVFQNFIKVFTQLEHPLVVFLDDLQWADGASLRLIQSLLTAADSQYLFLIGAYRDNEVYTTHPLMLTLGEIKRTGTIINQIFLSPLDLSDVTQLTADALYTLPETVSPLATLALAKTGGNPFFINEFFKSLYSQRLLVFDIDQSGWRWDLAQIQASDITENLVELLAARVQQLPEKTQRVLELAACIGNQFDLQALSITYRKSLRETATDLWDAIVEGFILPLNNTYKLVNLDVQGLAEVVIVTYRFTHDRIQQAVYSLIPKSERPTIHWQIGQHLLLQSVSEGKQEQKIFDIVNHLNLGRELLDLQAERDQVARLNLMAGKRAKKSTAYEPALKYLNAGLAMVTEDSWHRLYELTLSLYTDAAELSSLTGDYEQMHQLTARILQQSRSVLDKAKAYEVLINAYYALENYPEAMKIGLETLGLLGTILPEKPSWPDVAEAMQMIESALAGKPKESLVDLPEMTDPVTLRTIRIMNCLGNVAWNLDINLRILIICKQMYLSLVYGNSIESPFIYANYGVVLSIIGDFDGGYQFSSLAYKLLGQFNAIEFKAKSYFLSCFIIRHWKESSKTLLPTLLEAFQSAVETGDLEYASNIASGYCQMLYVVGHNLTEVEQEMVKYGQAIKQFKQTAALQWHQIFWQGTLNLLGRSQDASRLVGEIYDEDKMLPIHLQMKHYGALCHAYTWKLQLCYHFQKFDQALENLTRMEEFFAVAEGTAVAPSAYLYSSLTRLAVFSKVSNSAQQDILEKVSANQQKMKLWAQHAPMNYQHKFYLVEAEHARVLGEDDRARDYYDKTIDLAQKNGYLNEESLAYELAARFYLDRGQTRLAYYYLRDAHYAYERWGALAKVKHLEEQYPQLLLQTKTAPTRTITTTRITSVEQQVSTVLDLTSILKAAQTTAGEVLLETLLTKMMKLVIENAGAERGYLILAHYDPPNEKISKWLIEAEGRVEQTAVTTLQAVPVEVGNLATAVVNYVIRTQKTIVLNDAANEGSFTQDKYIVAHQTKSILCMPLINQGKVVGLLYLENNLTTGAFTTDRVAVLSILAAQAAISLENARLYSNLATSEEKYRSLFENAPIGMFEVDLSQTPPLFLAANHQVEMMYGWPAAEFTAISSALLVPDDARTDLRQMIDSVRKGETVTLESVNRRRNGVLFPVRLSARPETRAGSNRMIVTVEDITDEKERQLETEMIEAERLRIAHEIHDGLAQDLIGLGYKAKSWHALIKANPDQISIELDQLLDTLNTSLREVRRSIFALRPIALDDLGIIEALRQYTHNFGEQYDLDIKLHIVGLEERLPTVLELPLLRIVQEALNNIRKHADATSVWIELNIMYPQTIQLSIRDNGVGFGPTTLEKAVSFGHVGLKHISERVQRLNGAFSIHSKEEQGTEITVIFPFSA